MFIFGPGIEAEYRDEPVRTVDAAPTLAEFVGIPYPDDLDGRPLITR
jgi:arylsulfatase A-like enzyme